MTLVSSLSPGFPAVQLSNTIPATPPPQGALGHGSLSHLNPVAPAIVTSALVPSLRRHLQAAPSWGWGGDILLSFLEGASPELCPGSHHGWEAASLFLGHSGFPGPPPTSQHLQAESGLSRMCGDACFLGVPLGTVCSAL